MSKENTEIKDINPEELNDLLLKVGPTEKVNNTGIKNIFDTSFPSIEEPETSTKKVEKPEGGEEQEEIQEEEQEQEETPDITSLLNQEPQEQEENTKPGKLSVRAISSLVKEGILKELEEGKPLNECTDKELADLIKANLEDRELSTKEAVQAEIYDNSHPMVQYLLSYEANGGKDIDKVIQHLAAHAQVKNIDIKTEAGQEQIVRSYLGGLDDMTAEEIEDEIVSLKDRKELEKKALQYQPKLEAKKLQDAQKQVKIQEQARKQEEAAMAKINETVIATLKTGDLKGLKIDNNIQSMIYQDLMANGAITTIGTLVKQLGVQTDMATVSKMIWFLRDQEGFEKAVRLQEKKENTEKTVQKLKTAGSSGKGGAQTMPNTSAPTRTNTIRRPAPSPFGPK